MKVLERGDLQCWALSQAVNSQRLCKKAAFSFLPFIPWVIKNPAVTAVTVADMSALLVLIAGYSLGCQAKWALLH